MKCVRTGAQDVVPVAEQRLHLGQQQLHIAGRRGAAALQRRQRLVQGLQTDWGEFKVSQVFWQFISSAATLLPPCSAASALSSAWKHVEELSVT